MNDFENDSHERIERFVRSENIARFGRLLANEHDEAERETLVRLIDQEMGYAPPA